MSMNVYSATGRIGKDCVTRQVGDTSVTNFPVAIDVGWGDKKHTFWLSVNVWGKRGESVAPYLLKGQLVGITGELDNREYAKNDGGGKGWSLELRANDVQLLGGKSESTQKPAEPVSSMSRTPVVDDGFQDSEIPF